MEYGAVAAAWMIRLLLIYTLMVVVVPYMVLRPILKGKAVSLQFLVCVIVGNFYYINIVLFFGLFHVTSGTAYVIVFLLPLLVKVVLKRKQKKKVYQKPVRKAVIGVIRGESSLRFCFFQGCRWLKQNTKRLFYPVWCVLRRNLLEVILFSLCMGFLVMYFAPYFCEHFGYRVSDVVVHQQWINAINNGTLFFDGIYPMGMHAVIYYIHAVFGIHTYILMQFFPFVSDIYIFVLLLIVIKSVCRFQYLPYIGFFCLIGADYIQSDLLLRYLSALPQEFGMMFYLPCLTAAIQFFRAHIREEKEYQRLKEENLLYTVIGQKNKKESNLWLLVLILSFGLTFAVHFYTAILTGILVVSVAIGYAGYVFRPRWLKKLFPAVLLSLAIPLLPMALAFLGGTPLQGSLYWAASVMGVDLKGAGTDEREDIVILDEIAERSEEQMNQKEEVIDRLSKREREDLSWTERLKGAAADIREGSHIFYTKGYSVFKNNAVYKIFIILLVILFVQIPLMIGFQEREYSRILATVLVNQVLLTLLGISEYLGLPVLFTQERIASFAAYAIPLCVALAVDSCILLGSKLIKRKSLWNGISFVLAVCFIGYSILAGNIKKADPYKSNLQTDGAAICLYDILNNYPDHKWTIVSCNEERNMMAGTGWHYEVIDFLQSMEHYTPKAKMQIPTQYVFFFIEKESLNYAYGEWEDSVDPSVSEAWASKALPAKFAMEQYSGTNRMILNSRMYYWMQEYKKRYPNDIKVYYEDDEFICYFLEQNEYYLHNFAIDYGYNER